MGFFSESLASPVEAAAKALDELFTSDDERAQAQAVLQKIRQRPQILQLELNQVEARHRSLWVAGWRPFIGWICGAGLAFTFIINPLIQWCTGEAGPVLPSAVMTQLVVALLGLGGLRTAEKITGKAQ